MSLTGWLEVELLLKQLIEFVRMWMTAALLQIQQLMAVRKGSRSMAEMTD
jgi:hypothetical protein